MANQTAGLFEAIGQNIQNGLYKSFTGKPVPGSNEAIQADIQRQTLLKQLDEIKRNPNEPDALNKTLQLLKTTQDLSLQNLAAQQSLNLKGLGANSLLDARGQLTDFEIEKGRAATQDEISLLDAKSQRQNQTLGSIFGQEQALAGYDADARRDVLNYLSAAQDKNLAAQAAARKPNVAALLGSLALGAASLFG